MSFCTRRLKFGTDDLANCTDDLAMDTADLKFQPEKVLRRSSMLSRSDHSSANRPVRGARTAVSDPSGTQPQTLSSKHELVQKPAELCSQENAGRLRRIAKHEAPREGGTPRWGLVSF